MGARQSKRSVDITTTPKKGDGEVVAVGEEKIEKLGDADVKAVVTNGTAAHTDIEFADKDEDAKEAQEKPSSVDVEIKENGHPESSDGEKTPEEAAAAGSAAAGDQIAKVDEEKAVEVTATENGEKAATETPETKKQKEKKKKKWSLRSISFSKKDKSKPSKDKEKNGDVNEEKVEEATSPIAEETKTEEIKASTPEEGKGAVTNGDASKEELADKIPEAIPEVEKDDEEAKKTEEPAAAVETPKEEPKQPEPTAVADKPQEESSAKKAEDEPKKEEQTIPVVAKTVDEEIANDKEVRSEEVPPPLPSSNPPSQVTVFAESTKADIVMSAEEKSLVVELSPPKDETPPHIPPPAGLEEAEISAAQPAETEALPNTTPLSPSSASLVEEESKTSADASSPSPPTTVVESLQDVASEATSLAKDESSSLIVNETLTTNSSQQLDDAKETDASEAETIAEVVNDEPSAESLPSIPAIVEEEKSPLVSSGGDVPNNLLTIEETNGGDLQGSKSDLNLKELSNRKSDDLSTIEEVESKESQLNNGTTTTDDGKLPESSANDEIVVEATKEQQEQPLASADDSLPDDLSTESLPSLPEPTDSLLEPMSLPPLDSVPEPLTLDDSLLSPPAPPSPDDDCERGEFVVALTNGNAKAAAAATTNGVHHHDEDDAATPPPPPSLDGPLKQIPSAETKIGDLCENSQTSGDAPTESVESAPTATE